MEKSEIISKLNQEFGKFEVKVQESLNNSILLEIKKDFLKDVVRGLKNHPELKVDMLVNHLGTDNVENYSLIYIFQSEVNNFKYIIKTVIDHAEPVIDSLEEIFRGINWFERETFDLLGIHYTGNTNLKRLLLPDDWEGFPLRKDYIAPESYNGIDNKRNYLCD